LIRDVYGRSAYHISMMNLTKAQDSVINIKFDTGACSTIISLNTLMDTDDENKLKRFILGIPKDIPRKGFRSASGNTMYGILCEAKNVKLSGVTLEHFYYYLIIEYKDRDECKNCKYSEKGNRRLALIGDDFISCCGFNHSKNSDIIINSFDKDIYEQNMRMELVHLKYQQSALHADTIYNKVFGRDTMSVQEKTFEYINNLRSNK